MGPKECVHHWWSTEQPGHCHEWLAVASGARHPVCHVSLPENCRAVVAKAPVFESLNKREMYENSRRRWHEEGRVDG